MKRRRQLLRQLSELQENMWNRNTLISDQDNVITDLTRIIKALKAEVAELGDQLDKAKADLEVVAAEREYWQGKAANP